MRALMSLALESILSEGDEVECGAREREEREREHDFLEREMRTSAVSGLEPLIQRGSGDEDYPADHGAHEDLVRENGSGLQERILVEPDDSRVVEGDKGEDDIRERDDGIAEAEANILLLQVRVGHDDERHDTGTHPDSDDGVVDSEVPGDPEPRHDSERTEIADQWDEGEGGRWKEEEKRSEEEGVFFLGHAVGMRDKTVQIYGKIRFLKMKNAQARFCFSAPLGYTPPKALYPSPLLLM